MININLIFLTLTILSNSYFPLLQKRINPYSLPPRLFTKRGGVDNRTATRQAFSQVAGYQPARAIGSEGGGKIEVFCRSFYLFVILTLLDKDLPIFVHLDTLHFNQVLLFCPIIWRLTIVTEKALVCELCIYFVYLHYSLE